MLSCYEHSHIGQLRLYNRTIRSSLALPEAERTTLLFILDRTIGYGKVKEAISLKEFQRGVFRRQAGRDILVVPGTGLSAENVTGAIDALREAGAIITDKLGSLTLYQINEDWLHPTLPQTGKLAVWGLNESDYIPIEDDEE